MRFGWKRRWRNRVLLGFMSGAVGLWLWVRLPLPAEVTAQPAGDGLVLVDRYGEVLRSTRAADGSRQRWLSIEAIDPDLLRAFLVTEDRRFYQHRGVDPRGLARAIRQNVLAGRVVSGASTITMQVARLLGYGRRTWLGKAVQVLYALRLDHQLSKRVILEQYLNRVPLGEAAVGVEAAAQLYFGISARELSLGQAAALAGLASAPGRVNPLRDPRGSARRRDLVLAALSAVGGESTTILERAREEPVVAEGREGTPFLAPHFTTWVLSRLDSLAGTVATSIDAGLQRQVESEVRYTTVAMRQFGADQAAAVVLDNRTGEVLAWVGSPDFAAARGGQVDMVVSPRQPGSTLKPFLYGLAFDRGFTPASILADVATVYPTASGPYAPRNYDRRYRGPVRAREALASSFNVPAVELASKIGVAPFLGLMRRAGFHSLSAGAEHYGLGLALGNGEVTLLELANGYRALANGGSWRPVAWRVAPPGASRGEATRVISPQAAAQVLDILADPIARVPGFGVATPLEFPFRAAAKTGTSRHFTDNWAVATTERFTVAVWVGNFNGRPMDGVSGVTGAGPLLQRVVLVTASRHPPGRLTLPGEAGLIAKQVCLLSGLQAASGCPAYTEWFQPGTLPGPDTWFSSAGVTLPPEYLEWAGRELTGNAVAGSGAMRVSRDPAVTSFRITSIRDGDRFRFVPGVDSAFATVGLRAAPEGPGGVRWFVDGAPHSGGRWRLVPGTHRIRARSGGASDQVTIDVLP